MNIIFLVIIDTYYKCDLKRYKLFNHDRYNNYDQNVYKMFGQN